VLSEISVVIPAYNAGHNLDKCLDAIERLVVSPLEVIVVDDGSSDGSIERAAMRGIRILAAPRRQGPAAARNIGAKVAQGRILFFLDSDVCVHCDALERVTAALSDPGVDAVIGSYDDDPSSPDFLSQYKNLMHCFVHQTSCSEASTFWSGCGAIRRDVFLELSGFDANYKRPAIEDIELGYRMREAGRRILLDRDLRARHLKKWSFWGLLKTDVVDRGIPWTELILRDQKIDARHMSLEDMATAPPPEAADAVSVVYVVSAFPNEERSRGEATAKEMRRRFPRACIVAVLLPGMLLQPQTVIEKMRAADKSASSLSHAVQICLDLHRGPAQ